MPKKHRKAFIQVTTHPAENEDLNSFIKLSIDQNVDGIHFDVMDGIYTNNSAMTIAKAKAARKRFEDIYFSVHLMCTNVKQYINSYLKIKPNMLFFQIECVKNFDEAKKYVQLINNKTNGGIAIDLDKKLNDELHQLISMSKGVLVMTVKAGASGQKIEETALDKIREIKEKHPNIELYVDGGINNQTVQQVIEAGATTICLGSYLYSQIKSAKAMGFVKMLKQLYKL